MDAVNQSQKSVYHFNHNGLIDKVRSSIYSVYELLTAKNLDDTTQHILETSCPNRNDTLDTQTNEPEDSPNVLEAASDDDDHDTQLEDQNPVESLDEPKTTEIDVKFTLLVLTGLFIIAAMASMVVAYAKLWLDGNFKTVFPEYPPVEKITVYEPHALYDALWEEIISKFLCFVDWIQLSSDPIPPPESSAYETIQESFLDTMKYCGIEFFLPPEEPPSLYDEFLNYINQIAGRIWLR